MHGIVSLLDEEHDAEVKGLWREMAGEFGIGTLADRLPYPHFSYQVVQDYDERRLVERLEVLTQQEEPFRVRAGGLGLFTGGHPVVYIPVVRTVALTALHERVWRACEGIGSGSQVYYGESQWMPHITLAEHDLERERLAALMAALYQRERVWDILVDNLAVIWDTGAKHEVRYRFPFRRNG